MEPYSPRLKAAMKRIERILKEEDIGGWVVLANGEGHSEYQMFLDTPSWSTIRFIPGPKGLTVHTKLHMASKKEQTAKTVNLLYLLLETMANNFLMLDKIKAQWAQHINVDVGPGTFTPDSSHED